MTARLGATARFRCRRRRRRLPWPPQECTSRASSPGLTVSWGLALKVLEADLNGAARDDSEPTSLSYERLTSGGPVPRLPRIGVADPPAIPDELGGTTASSPPQGPLQRERRTPDTERPHRAVDVIAGVVTVRCASAEVVRPGAALPDARAKAWPSHPRPGPMDHVASGVKGRPPILPVAKHACLAEDHRQSLLLPNSLENVCLGKLLKLLDLVPLQESAPELRRERAPSQFLRSQNLVRMHRPSISRRVTGSGLNEVERERRSGVR